MQTLVVGIRDEGESSWDAVALGVAAATTIGADLVFANIFPTAFDFPGGAVDAEWRRYLKERGEQVLGWARQVAGDPAGARYLSAGEVGRSCVRSTRSSSATRATSRRATGSPSAR